MGATTSADAGRSLWKGAKQNNLPLLRQILSHPDSSQIIDWENPDGHETPLMIAASRGRKEAVDLLVNAGAHVNRRSTGMYGNTALHVAAHKGHMQVVRQLLKAGADPFIWNEAGHAAIDMARMKGHHEAELELATLCRVASGWLSIRRPDSTVPRWKSRYVMLLRCSPTDEHYEIVCYSRPEDRRPECVIFYSPQKDVILQVDPSPSSWTDRPYMFAIEEKKLCLSVNMKSFSRRYDSLTSLENPPKSTIKVLFSADDSASLISWIRHLQNPVYEEPRGHSVLFPEHSSADNRSRSTPNATIPSVQTPQNAPNDRSQSALFPPSYNPGSSFDDGSSSNAPPPPYHYVSAVNENSSTRPFASVPASPYEVPEASAPPFIPEEADSFVPQASAPVSNPIESTSSISSNADCLICMDAPKNAACVPCGHVVACFECLQSIQSASGCPICRSRIDQAIRIYHS